MAVFCLLDNEGVIYIPEPEMRGWGRVDCFNFKLFDEQVGNEKAYGGTHECTVDLFIILTLKEEARVFEAELQYGEYFGDGHTCPLG